MTAALAPSRLGTYKRAEECMGTVFSFHVVLTEANSERVEGAVEDAIAWLHWVDETFSTYRHGSALNRYARGELELADCPAQLEEILRRCSALEARTGGYFSAHLDGRLDPSGYVKGWAIERASDMLVGEGATSHMINGGGDVQCQGRTADGEPWRIGIASPFSREMLLGVATGSPLAVATSGNAERGDHVLDPHTGEPARDLASVTLIGTHITVADAYATAAYAMGKRAYGWLASLHDYRAFVVDADGSTWSSDPGAAALAD
jgi:thiamine biosynthesis lipoprotein